MAQEGMDDYWKSYHNHHIPHSEPDTTTTTTTSATTTMKEPLTWYDYLYMSTMPFHPTNTLIDIHQSPLVVQQQQHHFMDQNLETDPTYATNASN